MVDAYLMLAYDWCHGVMICVDSETLQNEKNTSKSIHIIGLVQLQIYQGDICIDICEMYKLFTQQCGQRYPSP